MTSAALVLCRPMRAGSVCLSTSVLFSPDHLRRRGHSVDCVLILPLGVQSGKKRAQNVAWRNIERAAVQKTPLKGARSRAQVGSSYMAILAFVLIFLGVAAVWGVQGWVASLYAVLSLITFFAYWKDKAAAQAGRWRTPESTLHTLAVLGGWPGAILAQQWLRHKSSKAEFQLIFWITMVLNVAAFVWLHSPWGREWLPVLHT